MPGINNHGQVIALVSPIPEPETYAMLLAGLGLLGFIVRRRKTVLSERSQIPSPQRARFVCGFVFLALLESLPDM